jgi:hypothetical protein
MLYRELADETEVRQKTAMVETITLIPAPGIMFEPFGADVAIDPGNHGTFQEFLQGIPQWTVAGFLIIGAHGLLECSPEFGIIQFDQARVIAGHGVSSCL